MKDVSQIRRDYNKLKLDISNVPNSPFEFFNLWFDDILKLDVLEPTAFVLSTVSAENKPSSRVLLLKGFDNTGFYFYTNYTSRKGNELDNNNNASMVLFWDILERQIRIEGTVQKISKEASEKYFLSRPYTSKIGAWASKQSQRLKSRFTLIKEASKYMLKFKQDVPLPDTWGGYILIPSYFEFWQGRESRMHDRICFELINNEWEKFRLYP